MKIHCESIDYKFDLPQKPQRVISLVSAATETLFAMGCGNRVVGVSCYCERYVPDLKAPVVGDYLKTETKDCRVHGNSWSEPHSGGTIFAGNGNMVAKPIFRLIWQTVVTWILHENFYAKFRC